jgi:hypothetical protein
MKRSLTRLLLSAIVALSFTGAAAQTVLYGNEWIDYSKSYLKFKVARPGMYRISRAALSSAGVPASVTGSNFMLFRDGKEQPLYLSADAMSPTDYIEFWGTGADGSLDRELYGDARIQANERMSLFTDTAVYFLCYDAGANHLRFAQSANNIPGGSLSPEPYVLNTALLSPRNAFLAGPIHCADPKDELVSSDFETGEGFVNAITQVNQPAAATLSTPNLVSGYPGSIYATVLTRSYIDQHRVRLFLNNTLLGDERFDRSETKQYKAVVPASAFGASNEVRFVSDPDMNGALNVYGISLAELKYPRNLDMSGVSEAQFELPANGANQYLEFTNLGAARLYDLSANKWYPGNTAIAGKTRFYLDPATAARRFVLLSDAGAGQKQLSPVKVFRFTDFTASAGQGDFVIISHADLMAPAGGRSYVAEYAAYRSSTTGGAHKVVTADVTELYDQFAYGYDIHPLSIKHFLRYALDKWSTRPTDALLVGRGLLYDSYKAYQAAPAGKYPYPIVPTYGEPGSDLDFVMEDDFIPRMRIGRLPVWNAAEVGSYLTKLQNFENELRIPVVPTAASEGWKKRVMHVVGATDVTLNEQLLASFRVASANLTDSFAGKKIYTIANFQTQAVTTVNSLLVDSLLRTGTSLISYYGHASPFVFIYNLPKPGSYTCPARLPFMLALGCDAAQQFTLNTERSLSEVYTNTANSGSIGFLASDNVSFTDLDDKYLYAFYEDLSKLHYGAKVFDNSLAAHKACMSMLDDPMGRKDTAYIHSQLQSMIFSGDPAIGHPSAPKPDYHVGVEDISSNPTNVSSTNDSFKLQIISHNLGKAIQDSVVVKVEHINPKGVVSIARMYALRNLSYSDTTVFSLPISETEDMGLNKYRVTIDAAERYDETSEMNNVAVFDQFIYSDNLIPVFPKEFGIVGAPQVTLKASTLNPFRRNGRYRMEMDTTELFNSPLLQHQEILSNGGVIKWTPSLTLRDSTVYYWRTAFDSAVNGTYAWARSSFIHIDKSPSGWNQSHFYQYQKDNSQTITLDANRAFNFTKTNHLLLVDQMLLGGTGNYDQDGINVRTYWDSKGTRIEQSSYGGVYHALIVMAIDTATGRVWFNDGKTPGAPPPGSTRNGLWSRQFDLGSQAGRNFAARFLDTIPNGSYVMIKNVWWKNFGAPATVDVWKADSTSAGGASKTLYAAMRRIGFDKIDSFNRERVFVLWGVKGNPNFPTEQDFTADDTSKIHKIWTIGTRDIRGDWNSTVVGPAKEWQSVIWKTSANDNLPENDSTALTVIGVNAAGNETVLFDRATSTDFSLSGVSAKDYPYLKLKWLSKDSANVTSTQLRHWRVLYTPVPEAALNPAAHLVFSDSLAQGQMQHFSAAIENLTDQPMDSILVRFRIISPSGSSKPLADVRYRRLPGNDTLHADISFDPANYPGPNYFYVEANPDSDQVEEYHPNNLGYLPFNISVDEHNPLLDVTFDGVHILNGDIVSAKPFIKIRLKDENKYLKLNDTGLLKVSLRMPNSSEVRDIPFDGAICRFIPATADGANEAYVEYRPDLLKDGVYQLSVTGADRTGNGAGAIAGTTNRSTYRIEFEVDNTPSITRVLNYPNPFSTSTAFVFTMTGSQIPSQLKIQILSVTGKVVREITKEELGTLRIGRNITDYKWDGRDQFGQLLGNGVYLYRVVSSLNGQDLELRTGSRNGTDQGGGVDKYFKNGYGKMYIMR